MAARFALIFISLFGTLNFSASATALFEPSTGVRVTVNADGAYTIKTQNPAWMFGGDIGKPLSGLSIRRGSDEIGAYREIVFHYEEGGAREATIRVYRGRPVVLFTIEYLQAAKNVAPFPELTEYPRNLYHLTYNGQFGLYSFDRFGSDSPWLLFDSAADAFLLSPASHFLVASTTREEGKDISAGIDPRIPELPEGFQQSTILVVRKGINRVFETWGQAVTALQGKARPANDADTLLKYLGYWTDNGAAYYYKFDPSVGYAGTMLAVRDAFRRQGIPLGYLQLDSWFYPKGPRADWRDLSFGIYEYVADHSLFPTGLKDFQAQLGLPLATHARWIDPSSPYHQAYRMSGNVVIDPKYWERTSEYLADAGVVTYEQDWLDVKAEPEFNLTDPEAYFDNMASACAQQKLTMQYCMPLPRHYLQTSRYSNLTTIRTSGDRFDRERWDAFLYDSRLASALGVWPWCDVFMSSETPNLILATLSAGPVGVGDAIGSLDKANLLRVVRSDGVIVKPDFSLTPIDQSFVKDAKESGEPMIAATSTTFGASKAEYVFAYTRGTEKSIAFSPRALGFSGSVYVFNYLEGTGNLVARRDFRDNLSQDYAYYVVAPMGKSGMAFLGDAGQFVTLGKQRITHLADDGVLRVTVAFASGEGSRMLFGYSPSQPMVKAVRGSVGSPVFDAAKHLFRVAVSPSGDGQAIVEMRR
jgi:hypothetical protein